MLVKTTHFGEINIKDEDIIEFSEGIVGFEDIHRYGIIRNQNSDSPFSWLQAVEKSELAFAVVDPFVIKKDYDFVLSDEYVKALDINDPSQVNVYAIVVVPDDLTKISMNLKAPVIVNKDNRKAAQVILDTDEYTVRHYIMDELQKQEV
ncbi:flagellar assembly protein FliW [Ruminiclostridium cellulolyticum]|uniref:Flagellar assembly factor FliW n=1 Tax=Ruminiclostridium cellulolyticum (strain ATCC 35319 / DSM 5812 / JCM 6584 / H10) TaxID=394503 RepID=FLIW_RUMCH|nr:flagellar assembly protein FliW [Ruminiclostridium cellulolyticum]B8I4D2.1 RecName: Full=Flagellar assembly factor FliW [Ruminiclostridium cellulolyticum H10]ACL74486.1 protein of unknown function DUF180 [Ruminiclostridium cellulolyticum H10]